MKAGWHKKKLGDVLQLEYGKPLDATNRNPNGLYPVYGANGEKDRSDSFFYDKPSIIVGRKGSAGEVNLTEERFWPLDVTYYVTFDEKNYDLQFLYYLLLHLELPSLAKGVKPGINRNEVYSLSVNISSLPEQQRIVAILDEAFEAIAAARANAEQNRQNARALFESYLQSMFSPRGDGWVEKRLEEIGTTQTGSTPKSSDQSSYGNFMPFVKPGDFNPDGSLNYENGGLSRTGAATARKVQAGSTLMVCIGATIGKAGFCDRAIATNQQINAFTPNELYCHKFIYYQMITNGFQQRVIHASGQATLPIINKSKWSALTVAVPPTLDEQHKIVGRLDALRNETQRLESLYQRKIAALDELKQSLLQQAFSGQL